MERNVRKRNGLGGPKYSFWLHYFDTIRTRRCSGSNWKQSCLSVCGENSANAVGPSENLNREKKCWTDLPEWEIWATPAVRWPFNLTKNQKGAKVPSLRNQKGSRARNRSQLTQEISSPPIHKPFVSVPVFALFALSALSQWLALCVFFNSARKARLKT